MDFKPKVMPEALYVLMDINKDNRLMYVSHRKPVKAKELLSLRMIMLIPQPISS